MGGELSSSDPANSGGQIELDLPSEVDSEWCMRFNFDHGGGNKRTMIPVFNCFRQDLRSTDINPSFMPLDLGKIAGFSEVLIDGKVLGVKLIQQWVEVDDDEEGDYETEYEAEGSLLDAGDEEPEEEGFRAVLVEERLVPHLVIKDANITFAVEGFDGQKYVDNQEQVFLIPLDSGDSIILCSLP